jgi:hypothetical protein
MAQHDWVERQGNQRQDVDDVKDWEHPLAQELVKDPYDPVKLEVFYGFLARSPFVGHRRVYIDDAFSKWFDILEYMIIHYIRLDPAVSPLGKHVVWVDRQYPTANGHREGPWYP